MFFKQVEKLITSEPTLAGHRPKVAAGTLHLSKGTNDWELLKFNKEGTKYNVTINERTTAKYKLDIAKVSAMVSTASELASGDAE